MRQDPITDLKAQLAQELAHVTDRRRSWDIAVFLRTHRSELSRIRNGRLERISLERLIRLLAKLRRRVELRVEIEPIRNRAVDQR